MSNDVTNKEKVVDLLNTYLSFDHNYMRYELDSDDKDYFIKEITELLEFNYNKGFGEGCEHAAPHE